MSNLAVENLELMTAALEELYSQEELPSVTAVVTHRQEIIWSSSLGYASIENEQAAALDTVYHLGSITKVFTAVMLMQLRDVGQIKLDDPLTEYLPELRSLNFPLITLKQLASHTSGLPLMPPLTDLNSLMQEFPPKIENLKKIVFPEIEQIITRLPEVELLFEPGSQVEYSNLGMALLAHALERVSGQSYTTYIEQHILQPLGMNNSGFSSAALFNSPQTATCYLPFFEPPQAAPPQTKMIGGFTPTGALWSSARDMVQFMIFLTNSTDEGNVLAAESLQEMLQLIVPLSSSRYTEIVAPSGIGIGWFLSQIQGNLLAEHGGADPSTAAYLAWAPTPELAVFIATNVGKNPTAVAQTAYTMLELAV